jgi:4'-phosphopantetheinyl transferase
MTLSDILPEGHAHLWSWKLDPPAARIAWLRSLLSPEEEQRACHFLFPAARDRFIAGRGQLRVILGRYLGEDPASLQFAEGAAGKPFLVRDCAGETLHFNLAHSGRLAFLGVACGLNIGVDIEQVALPPDAEQIVTQFFSVREAGEFRSLPPEIQAEAFTSLWTRKEALLKATGEGIAHRLREIEVTFRPGEPSRVVSLPPDWGSAWSLESLSPRPGFLAAVAAPHPFLVVHALSCPGHPS